MLLQFPAAGPLFDQLTFLLEADIECLISRRKIYYEDATVAGLVSCLTRHNLSDLFVYISPTVSPTNILNF